MFNIVLYAPRFRPIRAISATCVVAGARLHLVEPLGFSLDDKTVRRRTGLLAKLGRDDHLPAGRISLARNGLPCRRTSASADQKGTPHLCAGTYRDGDYLVFGSEAQAFQATACRGARALRAHPDAARL